MLIQPFSVPKVWIPTKFTEFGTPSSDRCNLAGCENSAASPKVLEVLKHIEPRWLTDHWESQDSQLRHKLASLHNVAPEQVFITSGAMSAIRYVFEVFVRPETTVGLLQPDFPGFCHFADRSRCEPTWLKNPRFPFCHDVIDIENFVRRNDVGFVILSNPNAALGTRKTTEDIQRLITMASETLFVIDEADAIDTDSVAWLTKSHDNLLIIRSFSKFYGLSGLRVGYIIAPARFTEHFDRMIDPIEMSSFAILAATVALEDEDFQRETQSRVHRNLAVLESSCQGTPYRVVPHSVCFASYIWAAEPAEDPYALLSRCGVDVLQGSVFGLERGGRLNLSNPDKVRIAADIIRQNVR